MTDDLDARLAPLWERLEAAEAETRQQRRALYATLQRPVRRKRPSLLRHLGGLLFSAQYRADAEYAAVESRKRMAEFRARTKPIHDAYRGTRSQIRQINREIRDTILDMQREA